MNDNEMRDSLYQAVYEEFAGPMDPLSEEILEWVKPRKAYSVGVLYPMGSEFIEIPDEAESTTGGEDATGDGTQGVVIDSKTKSLSDEEEPIALSNADFQSAISLTIGALDSDAIRIDVTAGIYTKELEGEKPIYRRKPIVWSADHLELPSEQRAVIKKDIPQTTLVVVMVYRYHIDSESSVITIALRNTKKSLNPKSCNTRDCYFQCGFSLQSQKGFVPLPSMQHIMNTTEEELSNNLIYAGIRNYAMGHGCAADWDDDTARPKTIRTELIPQSEVHPTMASVAELDSAAFDMNMFADFERWNEAAKSIESLIDAYASWIKSIEIKASGYSGWMEEAARRNIKECNQCLRRIRNGYGILKSNDVARKAFHLANEAMLKQYLHYRVVANEADTFEPPADGMRFWRPFQIAFLLMNISSMTDPTSSERELLDLIWFPTGGGKTEAYLGLTAYTLILERLNGESCEGTTVIMRYTLRLLSSQQFSRAASLICALEVMRRNNPGLLGVRRFSIGFWVGSAASPNTWKAALDIYKDLRGGIQSEKSIPVVQCPWCGHLMDTRGRDYRITRNTDKRRDGDKYLKFVCGNPACDFNSKEFDLPLKVVDDEIYYEPPSLLLGTVDKFAIIPYKPKSYRIFGIDDDGVRRHSPKLIIQDELHLISGPLGSMVASYETLIDDLCTERGADGTIRKPKIIASTATVSRAKEQCNELFACGKEQVKQFPPSGISYDDSFFARIDRNGRGRRYIGLYSPNISFATASIKLYTQLLWEPNSWELEDDEQRDPYWTVIGYYGTTRELGQALTWTTSDIPERLYEKRRAFPNGRKRYLNNVVELTGRKDAPEVKRGLDDLTLRYPDKHSVDLCLATNMISVGLDVPRLGVMVVAGQPKETAEYIQATSRVGRGSAKGVVFTLYGTTRPRDRSHYESFKNYHESFYQHVEPSSATAFCEQVRERSLPGVLFGMYRATNPSLKNPNNPDEETLETLCKRIERRISLVDDAETSESTEQLESIIDDWLARDYSIWDSLKEHPDPPLPLMHPLGGEEHREWLGQSFEVPTSMRSVDDECKVSVIGWYPTVEDEEA